MATPTLEVVSSPPNLDNIIDRLNEAIKYKKFIMILASTRIAYEGRGASKIGRGDRLIIIKPDTSVIVHRPFGYSPVNWQPESHVISVVKRGGSIVLRSIRRHPREVLEVEIDKVYTLIVASSLTDNAEFIEYLDEQEMRDCLVRHPEELGVSKIIATEKKIGEGYADIVAEDHEGAYVIVEVKRVQAGTQAVEQLKRYIDSFAEKGGGRRVRGILVAPSISREALLKLKEYRLEYRRVDLSRLYRKCRKELGRALEKSQSLLDFISS